MAIWSFESFCQSQIGHETWRQLPQTSRDFLERLALPSVHPFCTRTADEIFSGGAPSMGGSYFFEIEHGSLVELMKTFFWKEVFPLAVFLSMWCRLLAGYIALAGVAFLLFYQGRPETRQFVKCQETKPYSKCRCALLCATTLSSMIVMMDSQYVDEFGPAFGFLLLTASASLSLNQTRLKNVSPIRIVICMILVLSFFLAFDKQSMGFRFSSTPADTRPTIQEGLYYSEQNPYQECIARNWPKQIKAYAEYTGATPWIMTGDGRTGLPYFLNSIRDPPTWIRVWLRAEEEQEDYLALDIAFPKTGHDPSKPIYLVLHGLNGGSSEGYVVDLAARRVAQGSTVVVLIARGLMDTPIRGWSFFHGARVLDAHTTATTLRDRVLGPGQSLVGVGYSLGGIVLNKYVMSYGDNVALDSGVSISGSLNCHCQAKFERSQRTWQPMIAGFMREELLIPKWGHRLLHRLGPDKYRDFLRTTDVVGIDRHAIAPYNGYHNLTDYYTAMSAFGVYADTECHSNDDIEPRLANLSIPFLILQSFDDPISTWRNVAANDGAMHPYRLVNAGQGNLMMMLTKIGGHVGWPIGLWPGKANWQFMSEVASNFVESSVQCRTDPGYSSFPTAMKKASFYSPELAQQLNSSSFGAGKETFLFRYSRQENTF